MTRSALCLSLFILFLLDLIYYGVVQHMYDWKSEADIVGCAVMAGLTLLFWESPHG